VRAVCTRALFAPTPRPHAALASSRVAPLRRGSESPYAGLVSPASARALADPEEGDRLLADAAGARFHAAQFLEQLPVQLLLPLSVLYVLPARGLGAAANVIGLPLPFRGPAILLVLVFTAATSAPLAVIAAWAARGWVGASTDDAATAVLRIDVVAVVVTLCTHRLAVAFKYAFTPEHTYAQRMRDWAPSTERAGSQLVSTWFTLTPDAVAREMAAAVDGLDEDEATAAFSLSPSAFAHLRMSLCGDALASLDAGLAKGAEAGGARVVTVGQLAAALLLHVNAQRAGRVRALQRIALLVGLVSTFASTVLRAVYGLPVLGADAIERVVIVGHWVSNVIMLPTAFSFLCVGVVDHLRRARALDHLARIFEPSSRRAGGGTVGLLATTVRPAILALDSLADVRAFLATRHLLLSFGAGFHKRLVVVIGTNLVVFLGAAAYCLVALIIAQVSAAAVAPVVLLNVLVGPAIAFCAAGLTCAAMANASAAKGIAVIVHARLRARLAADAGVAPPAVSLALLDDVERALRERAEPVNILGVAATPALGSALMGFFASVETVVVTILLQRLTR